jgi:DNA repair protein RadC
MTKQIQETAALLNIKVLDHLIVGENGYYSFADEGRMEERSLNADSPR